MGPENAVPAPNAMIPADAAGGMVKYNDDIFKAATKSGDYLPRLQLMTANSDPCKGGKFPINHYALIRDQNFQDVGEAVDMLVISWRPKALEIGENVISVFKIENPEFQRIQSKSAEQDSGCMYGIEFLVWIPAVKEFATFFCGSKSSRREAPAIRTLVSKAATLKAKLCENKKYKWYAPSVTPCSTPFDPPNLTKVKEVVDKFNNPPETTVEVADEAASADRAR